MTLPDLESLRCFEAAATHLNFRVASRRVALSPPAFSDRIRRLEELLGAALFLRSTRRMSLTQAGGALLPQARRVLDAAAGCAAVVQGGGVRAPFSLTLATRFELGLSWLTPALEPLARARPERTLHLSFADTADMFRRLKEGHVDGAVTSARLTSAWVRSAPLHRETYVFVVAPGALRRAPLRSPDDAVGHALLDISSDLPLFQYFAGARPTSESWTFARKEYLGTIAAVRHRALDGAGVAVLPAYFAQPDLARGRLVPLLPATRLKDDHFRLVWREGHRFEPELVELAEALRRLPLR